MADNEFVTIHKKDGSSYKMHVSQFDADNKERQIKVNADEAAKLNGATKEEKEKLRDELKDLRQQKKDLLAQNMKENGEFVGTQRSLAKLNSLNEKIANKEYDLHSKLSPTVSEEKWKGNVTKLSRDEANVVRQDMLKNKQMYVAMSLASQGVSFVEGGNTLDTPIDSLYKSNPKKTYALFENTRRMLKAKYGSTITLYRAGTSQTSKTTVNMTSSKENAQQYGDIYGTKVTSKKIPIENILAVNISRSGGYEEFIILK